MRATPASVPGRRIALRAVLEKPYSADAHPVNVTHLTTTPSARYPKVLQELLVETCVDEYAVPFQERH